MHYRRVLFSFALASSAVTALAAPLASKFTYQGRLTDSGAPFTGTADFGFRLWDAETGGTEVAAAAFAPNVAVEDGLFTVELDFGASSFNGDARWLEIGVRTPPGAGSYTPLTPRQPLTAAPYSLQTRGTFVDPDLNIGINEAAPVARLHLSGSGNLGSFFTAANLGTDQMVIEAGQAWLGLYSDHIGAPGSGISLGEINTTTGEMTKWSIVQRTGGSGGDLSITYGSDPAGNANARFLQVKPTGDVSIGVDNPSARLHVKAIGSEDNVVPASFRAASEYPTASGSSTEYIEFKGNQVSAIKDSASAMLKLQPSGGQVRIGSLNVAVDDPKLIVSRDSSLITNDNLAFEDVLIHDTGNAWLGLYSDNQGNVGSGITFSEYDLVNQHKWAMYARTTDNVGDFVITYGLDTNPTANEKMLQIDRDGTTKVKVLEILGADVAERFPTTDRVAPGHVVMIDAASPGQLCLARGAYNPRVAGVVSGAGDIPVGAILGNLPGQEEAPPIALTGRVWTKCDASGGAIEPGDLLTTSETPGHAMKATDAVRRQGAVIGKAMSGLAADNMGLVLVLIQPQ